MKGILYRRFFLVFVFLFFTATACSLPVFAGQQATPAETPAAQLTVDAMMTQSAGASPTPGVLAPTSTQPAPTLQPSITLLPSATRIVIPTATQTPVCDRAEFIADISIPDGSILQAGAPFTKTWRIKNAGSCSWTPDYAVVFSSGEGMNGPVSQKIGASVPSGQTIDISVPMTAPGQPGSYRGNWKLRNAAGAIFGIGPAAEHFYVDIKVVSAPASGSGYDFGANLCLAQWTGGSKSLPCIGEDKDANGFILYQSRPVLESGYVDDEPALLTNPPSSTDSVIRGKYPAYTVKNNDHFLSILSCDYSAKKCNVRFQLDYQIDNGSIQTLGSWAEANEGGVSAVDIDLSSLAGKNVSFILTVFSNGASEQDRALWLLPRIAQSLPPTVTPTLTATPTLTPTVTQQAYP